MLYQLSKLIHVAGFILGIGVMLSATVAFKHFWALYDTNKVQGIAAFKAFGNVQKFGMIGLLLVLAGGISMFALSDWAFWDMLWFKIKMALVVIMLVNGFTFGRTSTLALQSFLKSGSTDANRARELQSKVRMFQLLQISIFAAIILLSVFRFSGE
jgi:hypothetical protein